MTSGLEAAPDVPEGVLSDLLQPVFVEAQVVAFVGAQHLLEDVLVIWWVPLHLRTVNEALDL